MEKTIFELLENSNDIIMVPTDANLFILELWEVILSLSVVFILGLAIGLYISSQIDLFISRNIKQNNNGNKN